MSYLFGREKLNVANTNISKTYIFRPSQKTLRVNDESIRTILVVINLKDNIIIYNPETPSLGGSQNGRSLQLNYDTTSMSDEDDLLIIYNEEETEEDIVLFKEIVDELRIHTKLLKKILD